MLTFVLTNRSLPSARASTPVYRSVSRLSPVHTVVHDVVTVLSRGAQHLYHLRRWSLD